MKFGFRKPRAIAKEVQLPKSHADENGHPQNCLNCSAALVGSYCHVCGQSAHTHRMSFKHFVLHDVAHGIFHLEKGIIYTLKQVLTRPGKAAREYLAGRRVGYFNLLTLLLMCAALYIYSQGTLETVELKGTRLGSVVNFFGHYVKWIILCSGFVFSFSTCLLFRRAHLNYTEHLILNGFLLAGVLLINSLESLLINLLKTEDSGLIPAMLTGIYVSWGYWGAFRQDYSLSGWFFRIVLHFLLSITITFFIILGGLTVYLKLINPKS